MSCPKKLRSLSAVLVVSMLITACENETLVTKVDPAKPHSQTTDGVLFSLPETVLVTEVPVTKVASSPGTYHEWTRFFYPELTADDYVSEESVSFKIGTPAFTTRGQTDPNNVYIAHIKAKAFETKTLLLEFNEDGIIARTEASSKDESIDIITSGIKTVASIVAPLATGIPTGREDLFREGRTEEAVGVDCEKRAQAAAAATEAADKAQAKADKNPHSTQLGMNANSLRKIADAAEAALAQCHEDEFKSELSSKDLALYNSLEDSYRKFLRENLGFDFLLFLLRKQAGQDAKSANIEFFLTLSADQQKIIEEMEPRSTSPCVEAPSGTRCLALASKLELVRAKAVYDKIQDLRSQHESFLAEETPANVNSSANLEFRLKELDARVKALEETYFLGTSSETTSTAKFQFKPLAGGATQTQSLFTYSAGGPQPGICVVTAESAGVFTAVWPPKLAGKCHGANMLFETGDFQDLKSLVAKLKPAAGRDPISSYIYSQLTNGTQALLTSPFELPTAKKRLLNALAIDFNSILNNGISIYSNAPFDQVKLSAATLELIAKPRLSAAEIIELNRRLMEDTYSGEIYSFKSWLAHQVSLSIDAAPSSLATTVQNAGLNEPGKRGFPYRVAATTIARLKDDDAEKGRDSVRIAQFGPIQTLPAQLGGRRSSYKITYYDASGAIKVFDMSADALIEKQNVTDLTDAATTLRDSEAAKLKRETDLLTAKKAKLDAEKALITAEKDLKAAQASPSPSPTP